MVVMAQHVLRFFGIASALATATCLVILPGGLVAQTLNSGERRVLLDADSAASSVYYSRHRLRPRQSVRSFGVAQKSYAQPEMAQPDDDGAAIHSPASFFPETAISRSPDAFQPAQPLPPSRIIYESNTWPKTKVKPSAKIEISSDREALTKKPVSDQREIQAELNAKASYALNERVSFFADTALIQTVEKGNDGGSEQKTDLDIDELWATIETESDEAHTALVVGRQKLKEPRKWWYDESLDGIKLKIEQADKGLEIAVAEALAAKTVGETLSPEEEDILRVILRTYWEWAEDHQLEAYAIHQNDRSLPHGELVGISTDDEDELDSQLTWVGFRSSGTKTFVYSAAEIDYWLDLGFVKGSETETDYDRLDNDVSQVTGVDKYDVNGWGVDVGASMKTDLLGQPELLMRYAYGSGDDSLDDMTDSAYRQTSLQGNEMDFGGNTGIRYYGEVFRPELSNLHIYSLGVGFPVLDNSAISVLLHKYKQAVVNRNLRDNGLDMKPVGNHADIGTEIDLILSLKEWSDIEIELIAGLFSAGKAFGEQHKATNRSVGIKAKYKL